MPAIDPRRFGTDLRLLPALELVKSSRDPGHDLATTRRRLTGQAELDARTGADRLIDMNTYEGVDNLVQALLLRFLTPVGELATLGHPDYGPAPPQLNRGPEKPTKRKRAHSVLL